MQATQAMQPAPEATGAIGAAAASSATGAPGAGSVLLEVSGLQMHFPVRRGILRRVVGHVRAVDDVSFAVRAGETLGLVGESGCGKTTTGRCILRVYRPNGGQLLYRRADGRVADLAGLSGPALKPYRREIRLIFQDPQSSLNPRWNVLDIVGEPIRVNGVASGREVEDRVAALLRRVGLRPEYMRRYPHAFSGGERQRIGIARALALNPRLVVADEPVSALDVSVRAQVLNLLQDLQADFHLTYLFISHDLSVVQYVCDRVAVMYVGRIVEMAPTRQLFAAPRHPYTEALLSAVPKPDPDLRGSRIVLEGEVADPGNPPTGCYFHPRCAYAQPICKVERPPLREIAPGQLAACHFAETLTLRGVASSVASGAAAGIAPAAADGQNGLAGSGRGAPEQAAPL
jgi:peptide/nickel transport system ATP-binding protein